MYKKIKLYINTRKYECEVLHKFDAHPHHSAVPIVVSSTNTRCVCACAFVGGIPSVCFSFTQQRVVLLSRSTLCRWWWMVMILLRWMSTYSFELSSVCVVVLSIPGSSTKCYYFLIVTDSTIIVRCCVVVQRYSSTALQSARFTSSAISRQPKYLVQSTSQEQWQQQQQWSTKYRSTENASTLYLVRNIRS